MTGDVTAPDQVFDGTTFTVTYTVTNKGLSATDVGNWTDTIWLAHDPKRPGASKGDVVLATLSHSGVLGNDPSVLTPPDELHGDDHRHAARAHLGPVLHHRLGRHVRSGDQEHARRERQSRRPRRAEQRQLEGATDHRAAHAAARHLVVTSVTPQATAVGGDDFTVGWTVQNQGTSPTEDSTLFDQVYLSDQPNLNAPGANQWFLGSVEHDGVVASGGSYSAQATFQLSPEISGKYVIVNTNTGGEVGDTFIPPTWEGPYTNNNTDSAPRSSWRWHRPISG